MENKQERGWEKEFKKSFVFDAGEPHHDKYIGVDVEAEKVIEFIRKVEDEARREEHQFFVNILNGIDQADKEMGNKFGGTKAIRHALQSRII